MCRLIVLNTASIQLLPTTVAAVRAANDVRFIAVNDGVDSQRGDGEGFAA